MPFALQRRRCPTLTKLANEFSNVERNDPKPEDEPLLGGDSLGCAIPRPLLS